jgi:propanediol dehydratase large subunit
MIDKNIVGYDLVKNVKKCGGFERCGYDKLFVVRQHTGGDYLSGLVEVRENTEENRRAIEEKYGIQKYHTCNENYIVWGGSIVTLPKGSHTLPEGGDFIQFYWS